MSAANENVDPAQRLKHIIGSLSVGMQSDRTRGHSPQEARQAARIRVRTFARNWRASQNKTANTYVVEIAI